MAPLFSASRFTAGRVVPAALAALGLLAGCGRTASEPVTLAGLADRTLTYALSDVDDVEFPTAPGAHRFTVVFSLSQDGRCTQLSQGVTATLNGKPMTLVAGGASGVDGRGDACEPTRAWLDFDPAAWEREPTEDIRVLLQDDSATVSLILQEGKVKRLFAFQGDGDPDRLQDGETYTFVWQPESETPGPVTVTLLREGGSATASLPVTQDGGRVSFPIPSGTPPANHVLTLSGRVTGTVLECQGVAACDGSILHVEDFPVSVQ